MTKLINISRPDDFQIAPIFSGLAQKIIMTEAKHYANDYNFKPLTKILRNGNTNNKIALFHFRTLGKVGLQTTKNCLKKDVTEKTSNLNREKII